MNLIGSFNSLSNLLFKNYIKVGYKLEQAIVRVIGNLKVTETI